MVIIHIKNLWPTKVLKIIISSINKQDDIFPDFQYFSILGSMVYIFFHKEEHILKSTKYYTRALNKKLIGFDKYTIYKVYVEK